MLTLFYHAFIESVLSFSLVSGFGKLSLKDRNRLGQLIGESQMSLESLYTSQL